MRKEKALALAVLLLLPFKYSVASVCPDLSPYYEEGEDVNSLEAELSALINQCSDSAEFFALLGAIQLQSGDLLRANESL